ncbi:MAG TPA: 50S ribosomal protein L7ae [Lachnospiraceae bacterium]|nr:50S ribosomal protein L7ae [Lachnospiraceae bacterium]
MSGEDKLLGLISIAAKGRNLVSGAFATEKAVKEGKAFLVIVADDAGDNTKKDFKDMCAYRDVPFMCFSEKEKLGNRIGKEMRACLALTDEGIAKSIIKQFNGL